MKEPDEKNGCLSVLGRSIFVAIFFGALAFIPGFDITNAWVTFLLFLVIGAFTNGYNMK